MKILYIHQYFKIPSLRGGTRSYDLAKKFVENGHQVIMITTSASSFSFPNNKRWNIMEVDGIQVHVLKNDYNNKMSFLRRIGSFLDYAIQSTIYISKMKADLVLATSTPLSVAIPALIKNMLDKTPFVFEARDIWPEVPIKMGIIKNKLLINLAEKFETYIYKKAVAVVALSTDMRKSISERFEDLSKVFVIPNISEVSRFSSARTQNDQNDINPKIVLYAGQVAIVNNIEYVVKLAREVAKLDTNIQFHIYGQGNRLDNVETLAKEKEVFNKNFFLKGIVSKNELPEIYRRCTVACSFVANIPVLWANSANKFFDTLAAAKPVVINHEGWQAEEIREHNVGFVLNYDEQALPQTAAQFVQYLNNAELLKKQQSNAIKLALDKYSLEVAVDQYMHIFDKVKHVKQVQHV